MFVRLCQEKVRIMSGTYQLSEYNSATMALWPKNPLTKSWRSTRIATKGNREPVFSAIWQFECSFGTLDTEEESSFFESRFIAGGLYNAVLVHPVTGELVGFTGTSIEEFSFDFNDIDRDSWAANPRLVLRVNLQATGTF